MQRFSFNVVVFLAVAACGRTADSHDGTPDGSVGAGDAGCTFEPPGAPFTFHAKNTGTRALRVAYGCGKALPLTIDTTTGPVAISTGGSATACEQSCEVESSYGPDHVCSDCGPGVSASLASGSVVDIPWDRRVYRDSNIQAACSGSTETFACMIGSALPPGSHEGTLTVCDDADHASSPPGGSCPDANQVAVRFAFDLGTNEATIEAK